MLGLAPIGLLIEGVLFGGQTAISIGWFVPLSEPVRFKPALPVGEQQFLAWQPAPSPFVATGWFEALSEPVRKKPGLTAAAQPFAAWQPAPSPFVATGWFEALSEPVRQRPRSPATLFPSFFFQPSPSPFAPTGWYMPLSEPVRFKSGLNAARQQFLASPSRLLPTPTITGIFNVLETKDTLLSGGSFWNRVISGEIGVLGPAMPSAQIGVSVPVIYGARVAITIL